MEKLLSSYDGLPEGLLAAVPNADTRASCPTDGWCGSDTTDCTQDHSCNPDCSDLPCNTDFPCRDCSDCSDTPSPTYIKATFTVTKITQTTARVNVTPGSGYTSFNVFARYRDNSTGVYEWEFKTASPFYADISGLTPGTWYTVNVCSIDGSKKDWGTGKDFQALPVARPTNWEWWSDVRPGQPVTFTTAEFRAFYDKIDEFRVYKFGPGNEWPNFKPVSKGTPLSAAIVNEARAAIAPMTTAAMPPTIYAGVTKISADYFNRLKEYLNSVR